MQAWIPLLAALIALVSALLVALYSSTAEALQSSRREVRDRVAEVRAALGRLLASRHAITFEGYEGWTSAEIQRLNDAAKDAFWDNYRSATFDARAALAGLGMPDDFVQEVVRRPNEHEPAPVVLLAQLAENEILRLKRLLDDFEQEKLADLTTWWIPTVS